MRVKHKLFKSSFKSWDALCEEATALATTIGRERLINISVALGDILIAPDPTSRSVYTLEPSTRTFYSTPRARRQDAPANPAGIPGTLPRSANRL